MFSGPEVFGLKVYGAKIKFAAIAVLLAAVLVMGCAQPPSGGGNAAPQPGAQASAPSVERSFSASTLNEGDTITVTLKVDTGGTTFYLFDEILPEGWMPLNASDSEVLSTQDPGHVKVAVIQGAAGKSFTYDVVVSGKGAHSFSGEYMFEGMADEVPIAGASAVTVQ